MICIGAYQVVKTLPYNFKVYNFASTMEGVERLSLIPPADFIMNQSEKELDMAYANWILSDSTAYHDLMKLLFEIYAGFDVFLISNFDMAYGLSESFIKFIQARYSINCHIINEASDLMYAHDNGSPFATLEGISNFDYDKERFSNIAEQAVLQNPNAHEYYAFAMGGDEFD